MSYVERYHAPIRHAFKIVKSESPDLDQEAALQFAVKSFDDSIGPTDSYQPSWCTALSRVLDSRRTSHLRRCSNAQLLYEKQPKQ